MSDSPLLDRRYYTVAEVAAVKYMDRMSVYRLLWSGGLPAVRVGRSYRIPEEAIASLTFPRPRALRPGDRGAVAVRPRRRAVRPPGPQTGAEATAALRARITAALGQQALTDRALAQRAGVDTHTLGRFLSGQGGVRPATAAKLATALGLDLHAAIAPLCCRACRDMPPPGYLCLTCGAETGTAT